VQKLRRYSFISGSLLKLLLAVTLGLVYTMFVLPVQNADAWYDAKWKQRKKIELDSSPKGAHIKENLTDFPVLIRLHTGNFSFSAANADGSDIRFITADDKSPLKHHIEKFDPNEEIALIWVKVPRISGGTNQDAVWMYYDNPSAQDAQDSGGTYDVNHVAVYHFNENESSPRDVTAYGNHATLFSGKSGIPSVIGNGVRFSETGEQMTISPSASMNFSKGFTFSAWVRIEHATEKAPIFYWDDGKQYINIGIDRTYAFCNLSQGNGNPVVMTKTTVLSPKRWYHLAVTAEPDGEIKLYVDGSEAVSSKLQGGLPAPLADMIIGGSASSDNYFMGDIDELRLSNVARPAGWLKAAFQSQGSEGVMTSYMLEEFGGSSESLTIQLMRVIVRTITLDGWLVIGLLFLMGCASLVIFKSKLSILGRSRKENETFSESFRRLDNPLALLDKDQEFQGSSLYRIYQAGCEELKIWLEKKGEVFREGKELSRNAMNSFRAAIEKATMHESRRLYAGMFMINISVAGGPFLGLLGTVWGVMNTFAGMAESGEANLAAIAPGVASALACTMAGLLVAIPALFASSYVTGLIKDMNADMNVFMDEFILRLEERQGDAP
jgi:biopolymer transport protein ExbB